MRKPGYAALLAIATALAAPTTLAGDLFVNGQADAASVARCLGMTVRTLQRRLGDEGQTFSSVLNDSRRELTLRYLGNSCQSMTSVAQLTGYSTLSSFTRWFTSEFGMPPGEWRKGARRRRQSEVAAERSAALETA